MTDKETYRDNIIQELFDKKIVVAIVNQHAYQWNIPKETEICEDEEYTEENIYTEMWKEKVLPNLTEDEKDFLKLWFAMSRKPKTTKIKGMYEVLCKKIKRIVNDQPVPITHEKTKLRYKLSDEEKESLLFSKHGLTGKGSNRQGQTIPVFQCSLDGAVIKRYGSAKEATKETGVNVTNISRVARGLAKTAGGFVWKYEDTDSDQME